MEMLEGYMSEVSSVFIAAWGGMYPRGERQCSSDSDRTVLDGTQYLGLVHIANFMWQGAGCVYLYLRHRNLAHMPMTLRPFGTRPADPEPLFAECKIIFYPPQRRVGQGLAAKSRLSFSTMSNWQLASQSRHLPIPCSVLFEQNGSQNTLAI